MSLINCDAIKLARPGEFTLATAYWPWPPPPTAATAVAVVTGTPVVISPLKRGT